MSISSNDSSGFHARMSRLELKLKQSEDERLYLEEKFNGLLRSSKAEEAMQLFRLREEYRQLLEQDRLRCDRNDKILHTLDRIENRTSALTAKTDRLRLLRHHYETCMRRNFTDWKRTDTKYRSTLGSLGDIHEGSGIVRPSSPSPQQMTPSPLARSLSLSRRNSLVVPDLEITQSPKYKFSSDVVSAKPTVRRRLFGDSPKSKHSVEDGKKSPGSSFTNDFLREPFKIKIPKVVIGDNYHLSPVSVDQDQNTSKDLLQISLSEDSLSKYLPMEKEEILTSETNFNKEIYPSTVSSSDRKFDRPSLSRLVDSSRVVRQTYMPQAKPLTKSSSFSVTSSYSQKPENYFSSERRSSVIRRPSFVYRTSASPQPSARSRSPLDVGVGPQPTHSRSKSPLGVVDDIFKKYLINYDKRYLSDPISESKYGKYLYPSKPLKYDYDEYNSEVIKPSNLLDSKMCDYKPFYNESSDLYLFPQEGAASSRFSTLGSNESLFSRSSNRFPDVDEYFPCSSNTSDWKEWNHYRDRYEFSPQADIRNLPKADIRHTPQADIRHLPQVDVSYSPQTDIRNLPQADMRSTYSKSNYLDFPKYTHSADFEPKDFSIHDFTRSSTPNYYEPTDTYQTPVYQKAKSPIIRSISGEPSVDLYINDKSQNVSKYDSEIGKLEDDVKTKENVKMPQTPKRVSFSNEFLYDDKSDPEVSLSVDEVSSPPHDISGSNESLSESYENDRNLYKSGSFKEKEKALKSSDEIHSEEQNTNENEVGKMGSVLNTKPDEPALMTSEEPKKQRSLDNQEENENEAKFDKHDEIEGASPFDGTKRNFKRRMSLFPKGLDENGIDNDLQNDDYDSSNSKHDELPTNKPISYESERKEVKSDNIIPKMISVDQRKGSLAEESIDDNTVKDQVTVQDGIQISELKSSQSDSKDTVGSRSKECIDDSGVELESKVPPEDPLLKYSDIKQSDVIVTHEDSQILQKPTSQENIADDSNYEQQYSNQDIEQAPYQYQESELKQNTLSELQETDAVSENHQPVYDNMKQNIVPEDYTSQPFHNENAYGDTTTTEYGADYNTEQYDQSKYKQQPTEGYASDEYLQQHTQDIYNAEQYSQGNVPPDYQQQSDMYEGEYQQQPEEYQQQQGEYQLQPEQYQQQPVDYLKQPGEYQQPEEYQPQTGEYEQQPGEYQQPDEYQQQPVDYQKQPGEYQQPDEYQQQPVDYQKQPGEYQQPDEYQQQPVDYQKQPGEYQQPDEYQQQPVDYQKQPVEYQQPDEYQQQPVDYQKQPGEYQQPDEYQQQPIDYSDGGYTQDYQQPLPEQYQGEEYLQHDQYIQGHKEKSGEQYSPSHYQTEPTEQEYNTAQYAGEYAQQPDQYEEGYQDVTQDPQNVPAQYAAEYAQQPVQYEEGYQDVTQDPQRYEAYQKDPQYQYEQQEGVYDQANIPQQYDQYEQQQAEQYDQRYQGEPDQYGNYDYNYDEQGAVEGQQPYDDNVPVTYDDTVQPTYDEGQISYGDPGYLPQGSEHENLLPQQEYPQYGENIQPDSGGLQNNPETLAHQDTAQPYPATALAPAAVSGLAASETAPNLNRVLESDSESATQRSVTHDDSSDFDFSSANK